MNNVVIYNVSVSIALYKILKMLVLPGIYIAKLLKIYISHYTSILNVTPITKIHNNVHSVKL